MSQGCPEQRNGQNMDNILPSGEKPSNYFWYEEYGDSQSNPHLGLITHNGAQEQFEGSINDLISCPLTIVQQNLEAIPRDPGPFSEAIATSSSRQSSTHSFQPPRQIAELQSQALTASAS
ncbi:hypothetical protein PM082_016608 [Marasmius tenuissimus]|nr:hypothetical protein PM082_016608 [Marasmius tenuissimus]